MIANTDWIHLILETFLLCLFAYRIFWKKENNAITGFMLGIFASLFIRSLAKIVAYLMSR